MKIMKIPWTLIVIVGIIASFLISGCSKSGSSESEPAPPVPNAPVIAAFTPTNGFVGAAITITGSDFDGATTVKFNGVSASGVSATGTTMLSATVPSGATSGPITVITANGTATTATNFTVNVIKGVAVDPYIVGATFYEDKNANGQYDVAELVSTVSNSAGAFFFDKALTPGSKLLIKDMGKHNGVAYTGEIMRTVDQDDNLIISPITTLLANGWTADQIISVLTQTTGLAGITPADLVKDPLEGIETLDQATLTKEHFKKVWATTAIHSFLSIMQGVLVGPGKGYHITYDMFTAATLSNGLKPQDYVNRMVERIGMGLDPAILASIDTQLAVAKTMCNGAGLGDPPKATAGDVIRGSTAIADYVIGRVIADLTYAPTLAEYGPWRQELGRNFYLIRNKNNPCIKGGVAYGPLPDVSACASFKLEPVSSTTATVVCMRN